jgi:hypothetical protein
VGSLTDVGLINVLYPIGKENIWHNQEVKLGDEYAFLLCVLRVEPSNLIPCSADLDHLDPISRIYNVHLRAGDMVSSVLILFVGALYTWALGCRPRSSHAAHALQCFDLMACLPKAIAYSSLDQGLERQCLHIGSGEAATLALAVPCFCPPRLPEQDEIPRV